MLYDVLMGDGGCRKPRRLSLEKVSGGWECRVDDETVPIDAILTRRDVLSLLVDGRAYEIKRERTAGDLRISIGTECFVVELRDRRSLRSRQKAVVDEKGPRKILAPMPGRIVRLLVAENASVEAGQGILVVEAMKMQNEIKSPKRGVVKQVLATPGASVNPGDVLAVVE